MTACLVLLIVILYFPINTISRMFKSSSGLILNRKDTFNVADATYFGLILLVASSVERELCNDQI